MHTYIHIYMHTYIYVMREIQMQRPNKLHNKTQQPVEENIQLHKDPTHCIIRSNQLWTFFNATDYVHTPKSRWRFAKDPYKTCRRLRLTCSHPVRFAHHSHSKKRSKVGIHARSNRHANQLTQDPLQKTTPSSTSTHEFVHIATSVCTIRPNSL